MPKIFSNIKKDERIISQGANFDSSTEILGMSDSGEYIDANNLRHPDNDQDSLVKIGGEKVLYDAFNNACFLPVPLPLDSGYECIGESSFYLEDDNQMHLLEVWAHNPTDPVNFPSFIRIDGRVVLMSQNFPVTFDHPLQRDINPNCVGGEIYLTDYNVRPMIFNLKDMMVNGGFNFGVPVDCTQKYFSEFNIDQYVVELIGDNNHPIFIQVTTTPPAGSISIGNGGLACGLYQYEIQKVTNQGDATAWCKATPLIPLPMRYSSLQQGYPYTKTFGGTSSDISPYGIHIRFRIDNRNGYDYIRIKRTRYNDEAAIGTGGVTKLLDFRLDISQDDLFVQDIFDVGATEIDLPDEAVTTVFGAVNRAKSVRYYNQKLVFSNIEFQKRDLTGVVQFDELNGKRLFPVIQKITTPTRLDGHKNPYNYAYYRSLMRGEKHGFAVEFRDGNNQTSLAVALPKNTAGTEDYQNYQMPNRRDVATPETVAWSNATVKAANVDGQTATAVTQTYEVFDTVDAVSKNDSSLFVNPFLRNVPDTADVNFYPMTPAGQANPYDYGDTRHLNYTINPQIGAGDDAIIDPQPYTPKAFGPNYYSLGVALPSISNIPQYIKSFSVVRTKAAGRIVAQGLGFYDIIDNGAIFDNAKRLNEFCFYSPDLDPSTGINPQVLDDIRNNVAAGGSRYQVQLVSPLGFFTEVYSGHFNNASSLRWQAIDLIAYARILREDGTINPTDTPDAAANGANGVGFSASPADGFGYTGYAKWRHRGTPPGTSAFPSGGGGNQLFGISNITPIQGVGTQSERFQIMKLVLSPNVYDTFNIPMPTFNRAFNAPACQDWHEPMYVMNIIDTLASVQQGNIQNYIETEHYQKIDALVGVIQGGLTREAFVTVDERPEDFSSVVFVGGQAWLNVTGLGVGPIGVIVAAIAASTQTVTFNGVVYNVVGVFQVQSVAITDTYNELSIVFDIAFNVYGASNTIFMPAAGLDVEVRYDKSFPIKAFGGDTTIHESIFAPVDYHNNSNGDPSPGQLDWAYPFPFMHYFINGSYRRPGDITLTLAQSSEGNNRVDFLLTAAGLTRGARLRQVVTMFTAESRICLPFEFEPPFNALAVNEATYFPATNYIVRPWAWDSGLQPNQQVSQFHGAYMLTYPQENVIWGYGGFRIKPQTNIDYSKQDENHSIAAPPKVGFVENTLFCTGTIWSLTRPVNVQDAPGLRTFPATNFFVASDDTGDVKYLYDELTEGKGNNLWAITESGICLLITNKTILSDSTGKELAALGSDGGANFITDQYWISKTIGMNDEFWRSAAEGYKVIKGDLTERKIEALFFSNKDSQFRLAGGAVFDIGRGTKYHSKLYPEYLPQVGSKYTKKLSSVYDVLNNEYWCCMQVIPTRNTTVFAERKEHYRGTFDYRFDKFTSYDGTTYGMRNAQTYVLDSVGENINGLPIEAFMVAVSAKNPPIKNFSRFEMCPPLIKPTKVQFFPDKVSYLTSTNMSEIDTVVQPLGLKNYGNWMGFVPRMLLGNRDRQQGDQLIFVIRSTGNDLFKITTATIGFTEIK